MSYVKHVMQTIEGVADSLGLSVRGVRLRIDVLDGTLKAYLKRGRNNEILFTGEAMAILRRLEDVRRGESISVRQAASRVREELVGNRVEPVRQPGSIPTATPSNEVAVMRELIEELRRDRDYWRDLALRLQDQLALPAPKTERRQRWWWPFGQ